jgi:hypothetical protein
MKNIEDNRKSPTQPLPQYQEASGNAGQDAIETPAPLSVLAGSGQATWGEPMPATGRGAKTSTAVKVAVVLALVIGLASLALNGFLIYSLLGVRQTTADGLDAAITALDNFGGKGFYYEYHFEKEIPVAADIPIQQDMIFPFQGDFPINTTVEVPVNAGMLGTFVIEVPINTSIYVSTSVPIHIEQTFSISTTIPVDMTIPIDVTPDDPEIQKLLSQVRDWLLRLQSDLF